MNPEPSPSNTKQKSYTQNLSFLILPAKIWSRRSGNLPYIAYIKVNNCFRVQSESGFGGREILVHVQRLCGVDSGTCLDSLEIRHVGIAVRVGTRDVYPVFWFPQKIPS